ncbi:MAG: class I SAM-dependent methyltransferase [Caldilineaceae bacterium]
MQSQHVDFFNHDPWASDYDEDVRNEADPIRAGYEAVLDWVVAQAQIRPADVVVDLGMGTGNTAQRIVAAQEVIGIDISSNMLALAHPKLTHLPKVTFVQADLLAFFDRPDLHFDALVSTYAIHHLTEDEKTLLFHQIAQSLTPGRRAVFGDLMFADPAARDQLTQHYTTLGNTNMVETFAEEFFWLVDTACATLQAAGFALIAVKQFSQLSWGICVEKP